MPEICKYLNSLKDISSKESEFYFTGNKGFIKGLIIVQTLVFIPACCKAESSPALTGIKPRDAGLRISGMTGISILF
jgi:hypothetical protein